MHTLVFVKTVKQQFYQGSIASTMYVLLGSLTCLYDSGGSWMYVEERKYQRRFEQNTSCFHCIMQQFEVRVTFERSKSAHKQDVLVFAVATTYQVDSKYIDIFSLLSRQVVSSHAFEFLKYCNTCCVLRHQKWSIKNGQT